MARTTAEIQADIEMTRSAIEAHLDALRSRIPSRWWTPYALLGASLVTGIILSRLPVLRVLSTGAKTVQTGVAVAGALAAAQQFLTGVRVPESGASWNGDESR
jgi:hypothetical protein